MFGISRTIPRRNQGDAMSTSVYGLTENNTGRPVILDFDVDWDQDHFITVLVKGDDDDSEEIAAIIVESDKVEEFFQAVDETKTRWEQRRPT